MTASVNLVEQETGFSLEGVVSFASAMSLRALGEAWIQKTASSDCVIDMSKLQNEDAAIFSLLFCWMRSAQKKGIKVRLVSLPQAFLRMQELFGLEEIWTN